MIARPTRIVASAAAGSAAVRVRPLRLARVALVAAALAVAAPLQAAEPIRGGTTSLQAMPGVSAPVLRSPAAPQPMVVRAADARFDLAMHNAPAPQVFLQLAQGSPYNMLVAPDVAGTLSVTLKDTTVLEAMDTLRELFGYEYRVTGNRIFVYPNTVQTRLYKVNYLPGRRQGTSALRVASNALASPTASAANPPSGSGGGNGNGGGGSRGDNAQVHMSSDADFWRDVQTSLQTLVGTDTGRSVVLNPAAGVVVVKATPSELRQVENYLKAVQLSIERQVMLEAKIVEVQLSNDSQSGVNWAGFGTMPGTRSGRITIGSAAPGTVLNGSGAITLNDGTSITPGAGLAASALGRGFYGLAFQAANFATLLNFLQTQGDVQVLSSPRIATLNNQKAVLKVGSDELYVTGVTTNTTSNAGGQTSSPSLTFQPFFSGISLDVTPQIDEDGIVMLHVHPTISMVSEKSKALDLGTLGTMKLPLATSAVNETDSIVRVRDGEIVAIGGLMKEMVQNTRSGLPGLQDAPMVGGLFRQSGAAVVKTELVILLKPTVIEAANGWPATPTVSSVDGDRAAAALAAASPAAALVLAPRR